LEKKSIPPPVGGLLLVSTGGSILGSANAETLIRYQDTIIKTLKDNSVRKRLLQSLPSIVSHLVINLEKNAYAVVYHNGKQSEWREVPV
jgi:hypothetical protein